MQRAIERVGCEGEGGVFSPPSRRGGRADLTMSRYLKKSARRGGQTILDVEELSDLPRRADFKVALNLLDRRCAPSSKEGIG